MNKKKFKGYLLEHYLEKYFWEQGIDCKRRGQAGQEDLYFPQLLMSGEAKCWKRGLKTLYEMKGDKDLLFAKLQSHKEKNKEILVVMSLKVFTDLVKRIVRDWQGVNF